MKVYIGPHKNYIGPYQIAEKILFWKNKNTDDVVYDFGDFLANIKPLVKLCEWVESKRTRTIKVKIHDYDTWNMDNTLAHIILPMLKQLREHKHGAPFVDLEDVPEHLHPSEPGNEFVTDEKHFERWEWALGEMIFAFESNFNDWEEQFWKVKPEIDWDALSQKIMDEDKLVEMKWKARGECDWDGMKAYHTRISNGFRLFGKYYESLWD
jgi:hypothetical protein